MSSLLSKTIGLGCAIMLCASLVAANPTKNPSRHSSKGMARSSSAKSKKKRHRGQQGIDSERVGQIQKALIREQYLTGEASGVWDQRTKDAMARYQSENHWQTKVLPDSRALIKLGLGPDHSGLMNPQTADISRPEAMRGDGERDGSRSGLQLQPQR